MPSEAELGEKIGTFLQHQDLEVSRKRLNVLHESLHEILTTNELFGVSRTSALLDIYDVFIERFPELEHVAVRVFEGHYNEEAHSI